MCEAGMTTQRAADPFDVDAFLAQPLIARVAAAGLSVRPVWYLWEEDRFWWLTGSYANHGSVLPTQLLVHRTPDRTG